MRQNLTQTFVKKDLNDDLLKDPIVKPSKPQAIDLLATKHNNLIANDKIKITNAAKGFYFNAKAMGQEKFLTYDSNIYGKLGFDIAREGTEKKSGNDIAYDDSVSETTDFLKRGVKGWTKLTGIGLQDTYGLGIVADDLAYIDFDETMKNYSSSRGGGAGFMHNTFLSSGYTAGILTGIAAEEASLALITYGSGLFASPVTGVAATGVLARGAALIARGANKVGLINKISNVAEIEKARSWLSKGLRGFGKQLLPLGNTVDFIKNADKLKDMSNLQVAVTGAGALVRDARKFTLAHSESRLEADLAKKEFTDKLYEDHYKYNSTNLTSGEISNIEDRANKVHSSVYAKNFGLIYFTNAITLDAMLSGMRGVNKLWAGSLNNFTIKNLKTRGAKVLVNVAARNLYRNTSKSIANALKKTFTIKGISQGLTMATMEGLQETGQDIISKSVQNFYNQPYVEPQNLSAAQKRKKQFEGGLYTDLFDLGLSGYKNAAKSQWSEEGLITFAAGFFMGPFAKPVGIATGAATNYITGSNNAAYSLEKTGKYVLSRKNAETRKEFKAEKAKHQADLEEQAKELELFFNDSKSFLENVDSPLYSQIELQEKLFEAAANNNKMEFESTKHELLITGLHTLLKTGSEAAYAENLLYMANKLNVQELNEVFNRTDITEANQNKFREKLKENASNIYKLRDVYDAVQADYVNPIVVPKDRTDPEYMNKLVQFLAYDNLKKELVFSYSKIYNRADRIKKIRQSISENKDLNILESNALLKTEDLNTQIAILEQEVLVNKQLMESSKNPEVAAKAKLIADRLEAYKNYKIILQEIKKNNSYFSENSTEAYAKLFSAYEAILKTFTKSELITLVENQETITFKNNKSFTQIWDTLSLGAENEYYQEFVDTLLSPEGTSNYLSSAKEALERTEKNKKEIILSALTAFQERQLSDEMLHTLSDNDLFFNLDELDDLITRGIMPSKIYNLETQEEASDDEYDVAVKIIDAVVKKLTGKKITKNKQQPFHGRKYTKDKRTLATLIRSFGIKINNEIDLNSPVGKKLIDKILKSTNLTFSDKFLFQQAINSNTGVIKIKFVVSNELPVQINEDGLIELDLRFASNDYTSQSTMSFENLITTGLIQKKLTDGLINNAEALDKLNAAMEVAKKAFEEKYPNARINDLNIFSSPVNFITAALNDMAFQKFLGTVTSEKNESIWKDFTQDVARIVEIEYDGTLLNTVFNIATQAVSNIIVDEIKPVNEEKINEDLLKTEEDLEEETKNATVKIEVLKEETEQLETELVNLNQIKSDLEKQKEELEIELVSLNEFTEEEVDGVLDPTLIAARNGNKKAQEKFELYGLDWEQTTTYRFVGQSEVDVLLANERVNSKRGMADAGIDVTSNPKVTTAATAEYRVTFIESFDKNNGLGKVRKKNEEDSWLERGRGYTIKDVQKIEKLDENGNVERVLYDAEGYSTDTKAGFLDSQVAVKRETITIINEENDLNKEYRITTHLDGSHKWDVKNKEGDWVPEKSFKERNLKDITYVFENAGSTVKLIKTEDYTQIQNPKMWNGLSSEQKQEVDSKRANKETITTDTKADIERRRQEALNNIVDSDQYDEGSGVGFFNSFEGNNIFQEVGSRSTIEWEINKFYDAELAALGTDTKADVEINNVETQLITIENELNATDIKITELTDKLEQNNSELSKTQQPDETEEESDETEVETVVEEVEPVRPKESNDLESLIKDISDLNKQKTDKEIEFAATNKVTGLVTRRRLLNEIKIITDNIAVKQKELDSFNKGDETISVVESFAEDGVEIITFQTPFNNIPEELRESLLEMYGTPYEELVETDVQAIRNLMDTDINYIKIVNDFNLKQKNKVEETVDSVEDVAVDSPALDENIETKDVEQEGEQLTMNFDDVEEENIIPVNEEDIDLNLFPEETDYSLGSSKSKRTSYKMVDGVGVAEYSNPDTGVVDVIVSATSEDDFVAFVQLYTNVLNPVTKKLVKTANNKWTSKIENKSRDKEKFKSMMQEAQKLLPEDHKYLEEKNISLEGLSLFAQQLNYGYEISLDGFNDIEFIDVVLNKASLVANANAKTEAEKQDLYNGITKLSQAEYNDYVEKIKAIFPQAVVRPYTTIGNIVIKLPILKKTNQLTINKNIYDASPLGLQVNELKNNLKYNKTPTEIFDIVADYVTDISLKGINSKTTTNTNGANMTKILSQVFVLHFGIKNVTVTAAQRKMISDKIKLLFEKMNYFKNLALEFDNEIYIINQTYLVKGDVRFTLQKIGSNETETKSIADLERVTQIFNPGATVDKSINTKVSDATIVTLVSTYADAMQNFSILVDDINNVSEEELIASLKTELNKCK